MILNNTNTREVIELVKKIGQGDACTAYLGQDGFVYLLCNIDYDPSKEAISMFCSEMPHIPKFEKMWGFEKILKRHGKYTPHEVYKSPFYYDLPKGSEVKRLVRKLNKFQNDSIGLFLKEYSTFHPNNFTYRLEGILEAFRKDGGVPETIIEAVQEIGYAGMNYNSFVNMEFSPRNVKVNEKGEIILLDILVPDRSVHPSFRGGAPFNW